MKTIFLEFNLAVLCETRFPSQWSYAATDVKLLEDWITEHRVRSQWLDFTISH